LQKNANFPQFSRDLQRCLEHNFKVLSYLISIGFLCQSQQSNHITSSVHQHIVNNLKTGASAM